MKKALVSCVLFLLLSLNASTFHATVQAHENTDNNNAGICEGYILCSVMPVIKNDEGEGYWTSLIEMNGTEIHRWNTTPDPAKMLPGGSIISATGRYMSEWDSSNLTQLDWNGSVEWNFNGWETDENGTPIAREHHDFEREGNPVGYYAPGQDFVPHGKTLILGHHTTTNANVSFKQIIDDVIYEVDWNGTLTGFEWHASDHIDEMGLSAQERRAIWLNPGGAGLILGCLPGDWIHINSVSLLGKNKWFEKGDERFNPENIIISTRNTNFMAIISRQTGKIVWRIGPDFSEKTEEGRKLGKMIGFHHAHMIPDGLPGAGDILVFDNGGAAGYGLLGFPNEFRWFSRVLEFNPITLDIVQEYRHNEGFNVLFRNGCLHKLFSASMSSVQRLPNGNTLVTEGLSGRVFQITPANTVVWSYTTPQRKNVLYRAYMVPPEWVPGNPAGYAFWGNNSN